MEIIKYKIPLSSGGFDQVTLLKARLDIQGKFGRIMRTPNDFTKAALWSLSEITSNQH